MSEQGESDAQNAGRPETELRQEPTSSRSRAVFERILNAALEVLAEEGLDKLTTRRVADASGSNVSTLYRYFPNKEAIVLAAFERWSSEVLAALDRVEEESLGQADVGAFLGAILAELHGFSLDLRVWLALHQAMRMYSRLIPREREHAEAVAERLARYMRHYGSTWGDEALREFGILAYEFDCLMVSRLAVLPPERHAPTIALGQAAGLQLFLGTLNPEPSGDPAYLEGED